MNGYELSRKWFDFCFDNPEKIRPNHTALYFFAIEHCNRLGWKAKFGFPTEMAKDAIGIKNYRTYINTINDLVEWGFIEMIEKSKNQYSANIIALANYTKATTKALDKATSKHSTKQSQSNYKSIASINKHITNKHKNKYIYNEFYDNEISKTDDENYIKFVKFLFIDNEKGIPFKKVLSMDDQITPKLLKTLLSKHPKELIKLKVDAMENRPDLLKKYVSFYSTLDSWCRMEGKR